MFHRIRHELLVSCTACQFIQLVDGTLVVVDEPVRKCWHNALAIRYPVKTMHTDYHIYLSQFSRRLLLYTYRTSCQLSCQVLWVYGTDKNNLCNIRYMYPYISLRSKGDYVAIDKYVVREVYIMVSGGIIVQPRTEEEEEGVFACHRRVHNLTRRFCLSQIFTRISLLMSRRSHIRAGD